VPNIAGEIRRYQRDRSASVRLPRRVLELRTGARRAEGELRVSLRRKPTTAEIARAVDAEEADVAAALDATAASQAVELQPEDAEADERPLDVAEDRLFLSDAFGGLDERERRIMFLRYLRDLEPDTIATELGISRGQLAHATEEALKKLRVRLERPVRPSPGPVSSVGPQSLADEAAELKMAAMGDGPAAEQKTYFDQPYHIELVNSVPPGSGWSAHVEELPGCAAHGATAEEAARGVEAAMRDWIADALEHGRDVPKARSAASHSGRLLVRMPQSLHAELARVAEREEISLNQFITGSLAGAVRWRGHTDEPAAGGEAQPPPREVRKALVANVLLLAFIAALAVALLVIALSRG
jgi:RNA polymerase sigma factor (sigma-70 family)